MVVYYSTETFVKTGNNMLLLNFPKGCHHATKPVPSEGSGAAQTIQKQTAKGNFLLGATN